MIIQTADLALASIVSRSASPARQIFEGAEEKVINFEIERRGKLVGRMWVCARIVDSNGVIVAQCDSRLIGFSVEDCPRISGQLRFTTPWLKPGSYRVNLSVGAPWTMDYWEGACSLMISPVLPYLEFGGPRCFSARIGLCGLLVGGIGSEKRVCIQRSSG